MLMAVRTVVGVAPKKLRELAAPPAGLYLPRIARRQAAKGKEVFMRHQADWIIEARPNPDQETGRILLRKEAEMKHKNVFALTISLVAVVVAVAALAWTVKSTAAAQTLSSVQPNQSVPLVINYQGQLTDPSGQIVADGTYTMTFSLYDDATAGNLLWTETSVVTVTDGLFNVLLGSPSSPLAADMFPGNPRWLGVQVDPDANEMTPRQLLTSVPYAIRAQALVPGGQTTANMPQPVYEFVNTGSGPALVTQGDVHIGGQVSWAPITGSISISPAAFQPLDDNSECFRTGRTLCTNTGEHYYAPVFLPDGSTVTKMTFYYRDEANADEVVTMSLRRAEAISDTGVYEVLAEVGSVDGGYGYGYDDTIAPGTEVVNNSDYIYWLYAHFENNAFCSDWQVRAVVIEYQFTEPY
jgi:hypothetical protein